MASLDHRQAFPPAIMSLLRACKQASTASKQRLASPLCAATQARFQSSQSSSVPSEKKESGGIVDPSATRDVMVADVISGAPRACVQQEVWLLGADNE